MGQYSYIHVDIKTEEKEIDKKKGISNHITFNHTSRLQELNVFVSSANLNKFPVWSIM